MYKGKTAAGVGIIPVIYLILFMFNVYAKLSVLYKITERFSENMVVVRAHDLGNAQDVRSVGA